MNEAGWIAVSTLAVAGGGLVVSLWVAWHQRAQGRLITAELEAHERNARVARLQLRTAIGKAENVLKRGPPSDHHLRSVVAKLADEIKRLAASIPGAETLGYSTAEKVRLAGRSQDAARDALPLLKELAEQLERGG